MNKRSRPKWQVPSKFSRSADLFIRLDKPRIRRGRNDLRNNCALALGQIESLTQRLIGHLLRHYITQSAMLITCADAIVSSHVVKLFRPKDRDNGALIACMKIGATVEPPPCAPLGQFRCPSPRKSLTSSSPLQGVHSEIGSHQ